MVKSTPSNYSPIQTDAIDIADTGLDQLASGRATVATSDDEEDVDDADQPLDLSCKTADDVQLSSSLVTSQHQYGQRTLELDLLPSFSD